MRHLIAHLADTQLDKRLYGLEDTRQDWFRALEDAFNQLYAQKDQLAAITILGDILDTEAVGSEAAYALQKALHRFRKEPIPILLILGNHDTNYNRAINWTRVCTLVNPQVRPLSFTQPYLLEAEGDMSSITLIGNDHLSRARMAEALKQLKRPQTEGKIWLLLHQALAELAPHKDAWDVSAPQIPDWIHRVFLGDFHNHCSYKDPRGIEFVYPGAIESVSFNQTETPGYILYDRSTDAYCHKSTQQRDYLSFNLELYPKDQWESILSEHIQTSTNTHKGRAPVVRVFYPAFEWKVWEAIRNKLQVQTLKLFDFSQDTETSTTVTAVIEHTPDSREEVKDLGCKLLEERGTDIDTVARQILLNPESLKDIIDQRFPKANLRPPVS